MGSGGRHEGPAHEDQDLSDRRVETWGAGERFVFAPYPEDKLREVVAAIDRWGMGGQMRERDFDRLALTVS